MHHAKLIPSLALLSLALAGCSGMEYRGTSPSMRTFADEPTLADYYVGMNLRFDVLQPEDQRRLESKRIEQLSAGKTRDQILRDEVRSAEQTEKQAPPLTPPLPEVP